MARRKVKNKEQTFEVSQEELQDYYSRYIPQYGPGGPFPATNPWFKIANLGNKISNLKNVSNKDIKAEDYMKFSIKNTAKPGDLSGDEPEFLMNDDGTFKLDENNKKIPNPAYDTGNRYISFDEKKNPILLTYAQNRAKRLNPLIGADSERVKSGRFTARQVNPITGKVEYVNPDGSVRTSGDIAEDQLQAYNAHSFNFDDQGNVVSWNKYKYNDYNEPVELITNPYDPNNPFNIPDPFTKQSEISDEYFKKDVDEVDPNKNIHEKSQKQVTEDYLKSINQDIDKKTKTKYGGQLPKAQDGNAEEFVDWSSQFDEADLQGELEAQAENYGVANVADINPQTGTPNVGSLSTYGEVWSGEGWDDVEGVTPTTDEFKVDDMAWHNDQLVPEAGGSAFVQSEYVEGDAPGDLTLSKKQMKTAERNLKKKNREDKKALRKAEREKRAQKRKKWGETLGQQATNFGNYLFDKVANSKIVAGLDIVKDATSIYSDIMDAREAERMDNKKFQGMNTIDNLITPLEANIDGSRGDYDTNTGLLRIDDAVVSELARYGKELYQTGGESGPLSSLKRFTDKADEIGYSEEDIMNQKLSLDQMKRGGSNVCPVCGKLKSQCGCNYKTGGSLPKAQVSKEVGVCGPIYSSSGRWFSTCGQRNYDPLHNFDIGIKSVLGKDEIDPYLNMALTAGYTNTQRGGTGGLSTYLGGNYGGILQGDLAQDDIAFIPDANLVASMGWKDEFKNRNDYAAWLRGRDKNPLQWGLGAYYNKNIVGDQGDVLGGYASLGNLNLTGGYNFGTNSPELGITVGFPIKEDGGEQIDMDEQLLQELIAAGADIEIL